MATTSDIGGHENAEVHVAHGIEDVSTLSTAAVAAVAVVATICALAVFNLLLALIIRAVEHGWHSAATAADIRAVQRLLHTEGLPSCPPPLSLLSIPFALCSGSQASPTGHGTRCDGFTKLSASGDDCASTSPEAVARGSAQVGSALLALDGAAAASMEDAVDAQRSRTLGPAGGRTRTLRQQATATVGEQHAALHELRGSISEVRAVICVPNSYHSRASMTHNHAHPSKWAEHIKLMHHAHGP